MEVVPERTLRDGDTDVARGDLLDGVGLVEDNEIVGEEVAAVVVAELPVAEESEEEGVVDNDDIGGEDGGAGALVEAIVGGAGLGGADAALAAHERPDLGVGFRGEVREAAVGGGAGPIAEAGEFRGLCAGDKFRGVLERSVEALGAEVVLAALDEHVLEVAPEQAAGDRKVLVEELFLEVDGVCADNHLGAAVEGVDDAGHEVGEALADTGAGLDDQVAASGECGCDGGGHLALLGAKLEVLGLGEAAARPKKGLHRSGQFVWEARGRDHAADIMGAAGRNANANALHGALAAAVRRSNVGQRWLTDM